MTTDVLMLDNQGGEPAKVSYTARRLLPVYGGPGNAVGLTATDTRGLGPRSGDLVLARIASIGQHKFLGQDHGRRSQLFTGDLVVVAYGARYSPDQFEAVVPDDLGPCDLAAGGGIAALVLSRHGRMLPPTRLEPLGLLTDGTGGVVNLRDLALPAPDPVGPRPRTIAVVGTSMNAGKTTIAASLVCGLSRSGLRVGAAKVTGTGAPADPVMLRDAGAARVLDFTDVGHASTYQLDTAVVEGVLGDLVAHLTTEDIDAIVLEIADGVLQQETAALLDTGTFRDRVDGVVFAAADSVGAVTGARLVGDRGLPVVALGGMVTTSPLAMGEVTRHSDIPLHTSADLRSPAVAYAVLASPVIGERAATRALAAPRAPESSAHGSTAVVA